MADIYMPEDVGKMFEYQVKTYFIFDAAGLSLLPTHFLKLSHKSVRF